MPQRELRGVITKTVLGMVALDQDGPRFEGVAAVVFAHLRARHGDTVAAQALIDEGWSNGYLYLGPPAESHQTASGDS